jgi:hypothetical protein
LKVGVFFEKYLKVGVFAKKAFCKNRRFCKKYLEMGVYAKKCRFSKIGDWSPWFWTQKILRLSCSWLISSFRIFLQ